jgi:beta-glucosidase
MALTAGTVVAEPAFPFMDSTLSLDQRLDDLIGRMTLPEKVSLLSETAPAIERLGIEKYNHGNESLHGVVRPGKFTVFPRPMGLAATFNPELIHTMADCISDEARGRYNELGRTCDEKMSKFKGQYNGLLTFWSPTVNMARDPRWGRTGETYGEDPLLTYRLGAAFTLGLQGDPTNKYLKAVATPKHYVGNNEEHNRFSCNAVIPERSLREYYLKGFEGCVVEGKAQSLMAAYNAVNGTPCSVNRKLLIDVLRDEWGFDGYVVGDLWSPKFVFEKHKFTKTMPETAALLIQNGLDLDSGFAPFGYLEEAIDQGLCAEEDVNRSVRRILKARFKLGMYDPIDDVPYNAISPDVVGCEKHQHVSLELARQSMVLLKNGAAASTQKPLLPFGTGVKKVAVVGPCADMYKHPHYSVEAGSANPAITPIDGIRAACEERGIELVELDWEKVGGGFGELSKIDSKFLVPAQKVGGKTQGLLGEYFNDEFKSDAFGTRVDAEIDFDRTGKAPDAFYNQNPLYIRWTGKIKPPVTGKYTLAFTCDDGARLWINGKQKLDMWKTGGARTKGFELDMKAGKTVDIRIEYFDGGGGAVSRLDWTIPGMKGQDPLDAITKDLDAVILVMGLDSSNLGEGRDKTDLNLPQDQADTIQKIYARNPNVVLVLLSDTVLTINWEKEHLPAILEAWYPGEKAGQVLAEILWGDISPSGKLPLTFCQSSDDLPAFNDYDISNGRTYQYSTAKPLFEFGYGLSYTQFVYADLKLSKPVYAEGDTLILNFALKNVGAMDGDEVAQIYVKSVNSKVKMPLKQLKGFKRISLKQGEQTRVSIEVPISEVSYYDEAKSKFILLKGAFEVEVGASSSDIRLIKSFKIR